MRENIYICGMMAVVSIVSFSKFWLPDLNMYLLLLDGVLAIAISQYSDKANIRFFYVSGRLALSNLISYIVVFLSKQMTISFANDLTCFVTVVLTLVLLGEMGYLFHWIQILKDLLGKLPLKDHTTNKPFNEHAEDVTRLKKYVDNHNIVGVCAAWGDGKSFVVDNFCKEHSKEYNIIRINVLAYKCKDADRVLIELLDEIFLRNGIFSASSSEFKNILNHSFLSAISNMLLKHFGMRSNKSSIFESLKADIEKLPQKVLIVFDDLERVGDAEYARQVLAIAQQIVSDKCKIIFEYDKKEFTNLGLKPKYLEKFIPVEMPITRVSYASMAELFFEELEMETVNKKIPVLGLSSVKNLKEALKDIETFAFFDGEWPNFSYVPGSKNEDNYYHLYIEPFLTPRKVREFFGELKTFLTQQSIDKFTLIQIHTIVVFHFIKHVRPDWFVDFAGGMELPQMPICTKENLEDESLCVLNLFQYNSFAAPQGDDIEGDEKKALKEQEYHDEINTMINFLLGSKNNSFTSLQMILSTFKNVLEKDTFDDKKEKFQEWLEALPGKNSPIFLKRQCIEDIAKALWIYQGTESEWKQFVALCKSLGYFQKIDDELLNVLKWAFYAEPKSICYDSMDLFTDAEAIDFNKMCLPYRKVLSAALKQIVWNDTSCKAFGNDPKRLDKVTAFMNTFGTNKDFSDEIGVLKELSNNLKEQVKSIKFTQEQKERKLSAVNFLEKNITLLGLK